MKTPDVVIVGAATRDLNDEDPRGWLLGGGVTFGALTLARMGLDTGVVLGLDKEASGARELELLRDAGARIHPVPLRHGPVFTNIETLSGRIQLYDSSCDAIPVDVVPDAWREARAWLFAPIASETSGEWAAVPPQDACVAFAWQGILRELIPGEQVRPTTPGPSPLLRRADLVAVSRHDIPGDLGLREIGRWLAPRSELLLTAGLLGGMLIQFEDGQITGARTYPSVPSAAEIDAAGAGDTMLAGVVATRIATGWRRPENAGDLRMGAAAASLLVEGPGMDSVPTFGKLVLRLTRGA